MSAEAPFVPRSSTDDPMPTNLWGAFRQHGYWRLLAAQFVSSLGDWIGIIAVLAIAARVSGGSGAAAALVMTARILPGFFLASIGGLLVDRWDRRRTMIVCDFGRAALLFLLPFWDSLFGLIVISLFLEILTLLWSPAKDASVPHLIGQQHLATANSLSLVAAYGTFPVGAFVFAGLARFATFLNNHYTFSFGVDKEFLALWADGATFFISAICIFSLSAVFKSIRRAQKEKEKLHAAELGEKSQADVTKGFREIKEGYSFIGQHRLVRGVMIGLGVGIVGGGALVPLGSVYAVQVLHGGSAAFSLLMGCLGTGASIGLITLLFIQKYLKRGTVFWSAIVMCGAAIVLTGLSSSLWLSGLGTGLVGAFAGSAYVTGFTLLQEEVHDDVRGRTFAALYAIIRVCMLFALAVTPLFANIFQWVIKKMNDGSTLFNIGSWRYDVPGVRVTLIVGGVIALAAGFLSRSQIVHPDKKSSRDPEPKEAKPKSQKKVSQEQESQHVARVKEATT